MKKILIYIMVLVMSMLLFSGCNSSKENVSSFEWVEITDDSSKTDSASGYESSLSANASTSNTTSGSTSNPTVSKTGNGTAVDNTDKASDKKLVYKAYPVASKFDAQADKIRNSVLSAKDKVSVKGKTWYVSNKGNDNNSGTSPSSAWATTGALKKHAGSINSGDAVLFERGSVFRGGFSAKSGVCYGAYGSGDKPCIYGSYKAGSGVWTNRSGNVWCYDGANFTDDVGGVFFDHGKACGSKKASVSKLTDEYDFALQNAKLYVYMSKKPTNVFSSIEVAVNAHLISVPGDVSNVVFDNLTIKYCGGHGIRTNNGSSQVTIKNCEIAYIGGSYLSSDGTRYGNGIEFWQGIDTATVTNCWIYQIYDSGITHQGPDAYVAKNITISGNLIEYCGYGSIEYWHNRKNDNHMENILYSDNVMRFAGFGYGAGRPGIGYHIHSNGGTNDNMATNFVIKNNIFDLAARVLLDIRGGAGTMPVLSRNTYSQYDGRYLGNYGSDILNKTFNGDADSVIRSFDSGAVIVHNSVS